MPCLKVHIADATGPAIRARGNAGKRQRRAALVCISVIWASAGFLTGLLVSGEDTGPRHATAADWASAAPTAQAECEVQ